MSASAHGRRIDAVEKKRREILSPIQMIKPNKQSHIDRAASRLMPSAPEPFEISPQPNAEKSHREEKGSETGRFPLRLP